MLKDENTTTNATTLSNDERRLESPEKNSDQEVVKKVDDLIKIVEGGFEKSYWIVSLNNLWFVFGVLTIIAVGIIGYLLYVLANLVSSLPPANIITADIALIAALISFFNLSFTFFKTIPSEQRFEEFVKYNYGKLKTKVSTTDRPILKALIMIKSKQPEFDLKTIPDAELSDKSRLFERLYK